jgi:hypothetical protein
MATERKTEREYTVVEVHDDGMTLRVAKGQVTARNQEAAMDEAVNDLPPEARKGLILGAFLTGSYREKVYDAEQKWHTSSHMREPTFAAGSAVVE